MRLLSVLVATATGLTSAHFAPRPGWHAGAGGVHDCPGLSAGCDYVTSWAATIQWRGCGECLPHATVEALPPDGIALQIQISDEKSPHWVRKASWPLRIRGRDVVAGFEGLPGRIGVYQHLAGIGRFQVAVWAFFGRGRPTTRQLARANAELAAARLPR